MDTDKLFSTDSRNKLFLVLVSCILVMVGAVVLASRVQTDFGRVEVRNVVFPNESGITVRAKLFQPEGVTEANPAPGIVYIHGYQNNRETSDAYCIELARRGFVVLNIDAIGRGNSGIPAPLDAPEYDETFGGMASLDYLKGLSYVDAASVGLMGHSVGGEIAYQISLERPDVRALVISGTAYTTDANSSNPANMLMIFGKYDEYRKRMTGVKDFEAEWMGSEQTKAVIDAENPQFSVTYGDFEEGTARRVYMPIMTHLQESHSSKTIGEALVWMREALKPAERSWIEPADQIWQIKEWATLVAMLACVAALFPLGVLLLNTSLFAPLKNPVGEGYVSTRQDFRRGAIINGLLIMLYLPLIMVIFGFHVFVVQIDRVFPMMIVNGIAFWFVVSNLIGYFIFRRWFRKKNETDGLTLIDLGVSDAEVKFRFGGLKLARTALLAVLLFGFAYLCESILEAVFNVDFRFIFPFASDLTFYRLGMFLLYLPLFLYGFIQMGIFLYGRMRRPVRKTWTKTLAAWSWSAILLMTVPLLIQLVLQYLPILTVGVVPFVGPSSALVGFVLNLVHLIIVLMMVLPLSTWFFQLTGNIYAGAFLNALLVTWMFASSQVIAPIPV